MKSALSGKIAVVTRAAGQADELITALQRAGARVVHLPTIEFTEPDSWQPCDAAIDRLPCYNWLVFTSVNGVRFFVRRLQSRGKGCTDLKTAQVAAVGERTEAELRRLGVEVELVPKEFNAEGLLAAFARRNLRGKEVLIPRAQEGRDVLEKGLRAQGARVTAVAVYKTQAPDSDFATQKIAGLHVDLLTFTSPSTFTNFLSLVGSERMKAWQRDGCVLAAIGQVTAGAMAKRHFVADILPKQSTVSSLVEAISRYFSCPEHYKTTS